MDEATVHVGDKRIGPKAPVYFIAEIGINHNGSLEIAKQIIDAAVRAGADAVKFQKRTPEKCVPKDQWGVMRDTPWGRMSYIDYRHKVELGRAEYEAIDVYCRRLGVAWFASCWDEDSVDFIESFDPPAYKACSAALTDHPLLKKMRSTGKPLIISTGMSTMGEIDATIARLGTDDLAVAHSTSLYPCPPEYLNLHVIGTLSKRFRACPIGYSGHEAGLAPTLAAVSLGARFVERHVTIDKKMWGTDQSASLEPDELARLVADMREVERSLGDGIKRMQEGELAQRRKLSRVPMTAAPTSNGNGASHANGASTGNGATHNGHRVTHN